MKKRLKTSPTTLVNQTPSPVLLVDSPESISPTSQHSPITIFNYPISYEDKGTQTLLPRQIPNHSPTTDEEYVSVPTFAKPLTAMKTKKPLDYETALELRTLL